MTLLIACEANILTPYSVGNSESKVMSIVPDPEKTDLELVLEAAAEGKKMDPELVKRVRERSAALRQKFDKEISVELLRSVRDE